MLNFLKNKHFSNKRFIILAIIFCFLLIFFRIYNIDITARFTRDESSDLVRMHEYYQAHKITLVGPISSGNNKVFGSLTYYMLMPFAIAGNFEPVSPAYGTAFWGVLTALLLILITSKVNSKLTAYSALLVLMWYPLLETSRWAWNPHLVLFWIALGIWFYLKKTPLYYFLSGLSLALAFHNHYIAFIATAVFLIIASILLLVKKKYKNVLLFISGYGLAFVPFIIFDLRHPPGLFFSHYLNQGTILNTKANTFVGALSDIWINSVLFLQYVTQNPVLAVILGIICVILIVLDCKNNKKALLFFMPLLAQLAIGALLDTLQTRYLLPGLVFFVVWLLIPRKSYGDVLSKTAFSIMIIGSLFSVYPQLHYTEVQPDTRTISTADKEIISIINNNNIKNVNIAILASPASDTLAMTVRQALDIKHIQFLAASQYDVSQQLIVLSTSDEKTLRKDKSRQMKQFKDSKLRGIYPIKNSNWKIYWFRRI